MHSPITRCVIGVFLAGLIVWLGFKTAVPHPSPGLLALFAIVAALLGPTAIGLIASSFSVKRDKALEEIVKIGEIERKIVEANTVEEKLRALEEERRRLNVIIRYEARRQAVFDRQRTLHADAQQLAERTEALLAELVAIEKEGNLLDQELDNSVVKADLMAVRARLAGRSGLLLRDTEVDIRIERWLGDTAMGRLSFEMYRLFCSLPFFFGAITRSYVRIMLTIFDTIDGMSSRRLARQVGKADKSMQNLGLDHPRVDDEQG